jgi:branched-chain amino acid transport system substrate-binding protein
LTGPLPLEGASERDGAQFAIDDWNAKGGVQGYKVVAAVEDDGNDNGPTLNAAQKLGADSSILLAVGPLRSAGMAAINDAIKQTGLPLLAGGTSITFYDMDNPWLVRMRCADKFVATAAVRFALEELKATKIGILYNNNDYGNGARLVMKDYLQSKGMDFAVEEGHNSGDKDMSGGILACKDAGCDCVIGWTHSAEGAVISRQYVELGMQDIPFVGSPTWGNSSFYDLIEEQYVDGTYAAADFAATNPSAFAQDVYTRYKAKYGKNIDFGSSCWYDGMYMALDAMDRAKELTRESIMEALKTIGVDRELELTCGKVFIDDTGIDTVHQVIIGQNKGKDLQIIKILREDQ